MNNATKLLFYWFIRTQSLYM